jgi:hypothetical protein
MRSSANCSASAYSSATSISEDAFIEVGAPHLMQHPISYE